MNNTLYLKIAGADKNPFEIALVDRYELALLAWFLCSCVQIYFWLQRLINNPSLLLLFHLSPLFRAQASSGGNIGRVCVPWLALGERSIQMCLLCSCGSDFWKDQDRLKPSDHSLSGLWVQGMTLPKSRAAIDPQQGINSWWNKQSFTSTISWTKVKVQAEGEVISTAMIAWIVVVEDHIRCSIFFPC